MQLKHIDKEFYNKVLNLIENSRAKTYYAVNFAMIQTYWEVGKMIVEEEQNGQERAEYGKRLILELSTQLTFDIGKGFDKSNLSNMRMFYLEFSNFDAVRQELTWTHYRMLMRVENKEAREFYLNECIDSTWSTRQLQRQITSFAFERMLVKPTKSIENKKEQNTIDFNPKDIVKHPYVLEFLDIKQGDDYLENELETELLNKLQLFLLELGRGFSFVARQKRVSTEANKNYYIDLVFYNYLLKCFVLIDLKVGTLTPQDVGQMDLYVRLYEKTLKPQGDNPTIGIILCSQRDETVVEYSMLSESQQLFASQYQLYLPTKEELIQTINREKDMIEFEKQQKMKEIEEKK